MPDFPLILKKRGRLSLETGLDSFFGLLGWEIRPKGQLLRAWLKFKKGYKDKSFSMGLSELSNRN